MTRGIRVVILPRDTDLTVGELKALQSYILRSGWDISEVEVHFGELVPIREATSIAKSKPRPRRTGEPAYVPLYQKVCKAERITREEAENIVLDRGLDHSTGPKYILDFEKLGLVKRDPSDNDAWTLVGLEIGIDDLKQKVRTLNKK